MQTRQAKRTAAIIRTAAYQALTVAQRLERAQSRRGESRREIQRLERARITKNKD